MAYFKISKNLKCPFMVVLLFCSVSRTHSYSYSRRRHSFTILHLYSLLYLIHSPHPSVCWCCLLCNAAKVLSLSSLKQIHLSHILHIVCVFHIFQLFSLFAFYFHTFTFIHSMFSSIYIFRHYKNAASTISRRYVCVCVGGRDGCGCV